MKGIELPINILVIIVIVLIVLLAVVSLFFGVYTPSSSSTTLQAATSATCMRVNPTLCNLQSDADIPSSRTYAARTPVYNFDANKNGIINDFHQDGQWATTYCIDDNLEQLCGFFYGCSIGGCTPGETLDTFDPFNPSNYNLQTEDDWREWNKCCLKRVCGCP